MRHGQLSIYFPSLYQVPIDVTAGWAASPVGTRPPVTRQFNKMITSSACHNLETFLTSVTSDCFVKVYNGDFPGRLVAS